MAQTKPKAGQFYGVSNNGTDGQFLQTDGTGGMAWADTTIDPTLTSIDYPGTQTAADPAGGESIIINGTGFQSGITCTIGGTSATTAFNSATQITITSPAKAAGQYTVAVTNGDGGSGSQANFIQYSGVPVWTTNSGSLGSVEEGASTSFQVTATEGSDTIEYAVTSGSLPSGYSLATATGAITGTAGAVSADTTSTFSITATDDENQTSSARSFSITVTNLAASQFINTRIYTGNGSNAGSYPSIGGSLDVSTDFTPDLVIVKARDATGGWAVGDSLRGNYGYIYLNSTGASGSACGGYGSNPCSGANENGGIGIGTNKFIVKDNAAGDYSVSGPGTLYQALAWKAGGTPTATNSGGQTPTAGSKMINGSSDTTNFATATNYPEKQTINTNLDFSMTLWTAGGAMEFPHGLSGTPDFMFIKGVSATEDWYVYHNAIGTGKYLSLTRNDGGSGAGTDGEQINANIFSTVNSTVVATSITGTSLSYVCYAWKNVAGFSKFGNYNGNGSTNGPIVETGFEPAIIIIKRYDTNGNNWISFNNASSTSNPRDKELYPNGNYTESDVDTINFLDNGFQIITSQSNSNASGGTYVYAAWAADDSTTTPSLASSFDIKENASVSASSLDVTMDFGGQKSDIVWVKSMDYAYTHLLWDSVRGAGNDKGLFVSENYAMGSTTGEGNAQAYGYISSFNTNGFTLNAGTTNGNLVGVGSNSLGNYISYGWKTGGLASINTTGSSTSLVSANQAAGLSVAQYTGTGSAATIAHGLGAVPNMIIVKNLDAVAKWRVYHSSIGATKYLNLNDQDAEGTASTVWNDTTPTSNVFSVGSDSSVSGSGNNLIAYCFKSITGFSSFGTYTASGSVGSPTITTGFAPDWVMIKNIDRSQEWILIDSVRGLNKSLIPDSVSVQSANGNTISTTATSFTIEVSGGGVNYASGDTMIYAAFKIN